MNIPEEAVEAVARFNFEKAFPGKWDRQGADVQDHYRTVARGQIEAAAPFIAAQALRDAARVAMSYEEDGGLRPDEYNTGRYDLMWDVQEWLDTRADELDPQ